MRKYGIIYIDKFGQESTEITSDGTTMYLTLRGIKFEGTDFEMLSGEIEETKFEYIKYEDGSGEWRCPKVS